MATPPELAVVVPVKGGPLAKSRLDLPEGTRRALAEAFARDTLAAVTAALPDAVVLVVTSDAGVRLGVGSDGFRVVDDPGGGLDAAVAAGFAAAGALGVRSTTLLLADHPALRADELVAALTAADGHGPVMVPDADGTGTALLHLPSGAAVPPTRFGAGSAARHVELGWERLEVDAPGLRTDVDDAASFALAISLGVGAHTRAALARATLPGVQATIHRVPGDDGGSALLDDGREVAVPLASLVDSGLLHLRVGQRVSVELDAAGTAATRVWIVGIGPGETIR